MSCTDRLRGAFIALLALAAAPAGAESSHSFYLEDLTWTEVKERMEKGARTVIIPSGGAEQNGPHIAIGKHNWIVRYTSGEIARRLGDALAAPVLAYVPEGRISPPEGHMRFPGSISLREEAFALTLEDAARSFKQHGFTRICFIGDSGGNQEAQRQVAGKLSKEWRSEGVAVLHVSAYYDGKEARQWIAQQQAAGALPPELGFEAASAHAGFMDRAEVMAAHPQGVRPLPEKPYTEKDFAASGVMGDARRATADYGKTLLELKIAAAVAQIEKPPAPAR